MKNGTRWLGDAGAPIQAHGGMIPLHEGVYYWYGENKDWDTVDGRVDVVGVSRHSSEDLRRWHCYRLFQPSINWATSARKSCSGG